MRSFSLLAPLTLLALGAVACASHVDGDGAVAGSDALGSGTVVMLTGSSKVTATDATITVVYTSAIATTPPSTITLTGATGSYSLAATSLGGGAYGATFASLTDCAAFTYAVVRSGATIDSGAIHTRAPGNVACPTGASITPDLLWFRGMYHGQNGTDGLRYSEYPDGSFWYVADGGAGVGYIHYSTSVEDFVEVGRTRMTFHLDDDQLRRATGATIVANYTQTWGAPSCLSNLVELQLDERPYLITQAQVSDKDANGFTWAEATGHACSQVGLEVANPLPPVRPITFANGKATVDMGKPAFASVIAGFAAENDGFGSQMDGYHPSYAHDNDSCRVSLSSETLNLTYADLPPDTPHNCSFTRNCQTVTVTCDGAGDTFVVHQVSASGADVGGAPVDMTASPTTPFTQTFQSAASSFYVCTTSGAGSACTATIAATSDVACCAPSTTCTNRATPPTITVTCPSPMTFYVDDSYTRDVYSAGTEASYTRSTDTVGTYSVLACPAGAGNGDPSCQSFSTYVPKTQWCGPLPPPPSCGAAPKTKCSAGWHCCGSDGWECGVCS